MELCVLLWWLWCEDAKGIRWMGRPHTVSIGTGLSQIQQLYARNENKIIFDQHLADPSQQALVESLGLPEEEETPIPEYADYPADLVAVRSDLEFPAGDTRANTARWEVVCEWRGEGSSWLRVCAPA